jgi:hypothetical protein
LIGRRPHLRAAVGAVRRWRAGTTRRAYRIGLNNKKIRGREA